MDQAKFESLLADFKQNVNADSSIFDLALQPGSFQSPIVLMVHGIGGNARHWSDPVSLNVNDTWLFDLASHPDGKASGPGLLTSLPYRPERVTAWTNFLTATGVTWINFSQAKPGDLLQYATQEVVTLVTGLEKWVFQPYEQDQTGGNGSIPPFIILCHSRGGLVTRAALKQLGSSSVPHLQKVITLCTPHAGSFMPKLSNDYNNFLHQQMDFTGLTAFLPEPLHSLFNHTIMQFLMDLSNNVRQAMLHSFGSLAQSPGFDELIPQSATLQELARNEQPLQGVRYYSFGGTNPTFVNFFLGVAGKSWLILPTASAVLVEMLGRIPGVQGLYGGLAELSTGDSAVSQASSHWPSAFQAPHQDFHLNHMQALVDASLQKAVLQVIQL